MKYTTKIGDHEFVYEGTPEEIATLIYYEENGIDIDGEFLSKKELIYDQDEAVKFIKRDCRVSVLSESAIRNVLNVEEDYMRSKGIIEE